VPVWPLVILLLCLAACAPSEQDAREQAQAALARGDRRAAIEAIEALEGAQADAPEARLEQSELWIRAGEAPRAVWRLEQALSRFGERADLRVALANAALLVGDPARAAAIAREIPESAAEHPEALLVRARALVALGDLDAGLAAFERAERERPAEAALRVPRIAALLEERRYTEARAALDAAYARFPDDSERAPLRAQELMLLQVRAQDALHGALDAAQRGDADAASRAQREIDESLDGLLALARSAPDDASTWQALTLLAIPAGRVERVEPALRAALAENGERALLRPLLAALVVARGDEAGGEALLRDAVRADTGGARVALVRFLTARGRSADAIALLEDGLAQRPDDAELRFALAELRLDASGDGAAAEAVSRFESLRPGTPQAALLRARLALVHGDSAGARAQLLRLAPELDTAATQYWLGRALDSTGDPAGAAHRMRLAAARDPAAPGPWLELLRLAQARGDSREAEQAAAGVVLRAPQFLAGWQGLVDALIDQRRAADALATAQRAAALQPDRLETSLLVARALRASGRTDEALARLDETSQRSGESAEIAAERVLALGLAGRIDAARDAAGRAIAARGDTAVLHHALAGVLFQAGLADEGGAEVERALALAPDDLRPLALRCEFEAATNRFEAAAADCARFLERQPDHARIQFALGAAQAGSGRAQEAEASYRRAAALDPNAVAARNNLALLLAERGDLDGALTVAQQAFAQASEDADVLDTLGWLYLKKGLTSRAVSLLEDAHQRAPDRDGVKLHLAQAYRAAGREDQARPLLDALAASGGASSE
jgi:tetratricopeptide (TPR) repeat protein